LSEVRAIPALGQRGSCTTEGIRVQLAQPTTAIQQSSILLYRFHASDDAALLEVEPFLDDEPRGVFATRAPQRPNPIGLSVVEIESITDGNVTVNGIDVVDQTPLLDIKPFVPKFDVPSDTDTGWLTASKSTIQSKQADERFVR